MDLGILIGALKERNKSIWKVIRKRDNYVWFRNLWSAGNDNPEKFCELYEKIRNELGLESDKQHFDRIWQYYTVVATNFNDSLNEWAELLIS